ncbi:MAG: transcriptional repressor LexA [Patescibacteria group bacterium]
MRNLTPRQKQILDFVTKYSNKKGYAPSHKEIGKHFKLTSSATISQHLEALTNKGYINKEKHQKRNIEIPIYDNFVKIPLLGIIAAGEPIEAIEEKETIMVPKNKLPNSRNIYALRVRGNSMVEEKINSGDIVLIKEQNTAKNGEKVVALIDNREATLKTFFKEKNHIRLQPANKNMEPIIVKKNQDFAIQGTLIDVIKNENYTKSSSYTSPFKIRGVKYEALPKNQVIYRDTAEIMENTSLEIKKEGVNLNTIYNENCLDTMSRMPDNFIDMTVTSPPYDDMRKYNGNTFNEFEQIVKELYRITKKGGVVVWVIADQTKKGNESGTSLKHALYFKEIGFNLFDTMIYLKPPRGAVGNNKTYWQTFEYMFVFSKGTPKTINLIKDRENIEARSGDSGTKRLYDGTLSKRARSGYEKFGRRTNVWEYYIGKGHSASDNFAYEHPAIFPEKLAEDHIVSWSKEGDVVYDPFMGSGTTAKMAVLSGRKYIGSELFNKYCEVARKRIKYI